MISRVEVPIMRYATLCLAASILLIPATAEAKKAGGASAPAAKPGASAPAAKPGASALAKTAPGAAAKPGEKAVEPRPLLTPAAAAAAAAANRDRSGSLVFVAPLGLRPAQAQDAEEKKPRVDLRGVTPTASQTAADTREPSRGRPVPVLGQQASRTEPEPLPGLKSLN
jgi:hypothetical protein